jgi:hypothetical protein
MNGNWQSETTSQVEHIEGTATFRLLESCTEPWALRAAEKTVALKGHGFSPAVNGALS